MTAQQAPAAAEADRLRAAGAWSKTAHGAAPWACLWMALVRGGVRWLAEQERRLQAARCEAQTFGLRGGASDLGAVSYTHLDVYKRQVLWRPDT